MKTKFWIVMAMLAGLTLLAAQCGSTAAPERVVETVVVSEKVVEKVVETVVVVETVEVMVEGTPQIVEKEVVKEVVVTPTPAAPDVERVATLNVAQSSNPVGLDCWNWVSLTDMDIVGHFAEPLFQFDRQGNVQGVVAESWEMKAPTEWILNIRRGMKFHDPEYGELTAEDVVASLEACFREDGRALPKQPGLVAEMELEIVDDYTVRVLLSEPGLAGLPNYWTWALITSKEYLEQVGDDFTRRPMGTGPYKFVEWVPNVRVVGERFEDYWGADPGVERIVWRIIPDAFTSKSEFLTGGIDVLQGVLAEWVPEVEANDATRIEPILSSRYIMVVLPVKQPPYNDQRVRQALNYAVNKEEMVEQLFQNIGAVPMTGITHIVLPEADPDRVGYPYDPEKAKQLLDEARADGVEIGPLTLYAPNDRYVLDKEMGEAIAGYWREIGLEVEYIPESRTTLFPRGQALEMADPYIFGNGNALLQADLPYSLWLQTREDPPSRGSEYAAGPPEWDPLIDELASLPSGSPESIELARQLDAQWTEYAPWVFVVNYVDLYGVSNKLDWKPYSHESRFFIDVKPTE